MIEDKNRIIRLYLDGYMGSEIAIIINEKARTIQRILREFKGSLSEKELYRFEKVHKNNKKLRADDRKENRKFMSDKEIAMRNPSAYTVNRYGDWILNRNKDNYTLDMPAIIKNDGIREYRKTFINSRFYI